MDQAERVSSRGAACDQRGSAGRSRAVRRVAIVPWGDLIEDFLAPLGMTPAAFSEEMTGGWLFGYVQALQCVGIETVIVCVSAEVDTLTVRTHDPTGASICMLPAPASYRALRRHMRKPLAATAGETFGARHGPVVAHVLKDTASYLATPPRLLAATVRREGCDAILCQEYEYPRFDVCVAVGRRLHRPVFGVFQGGDFQVSRIERFVRPLTVRAATGLVIGSGSEIARVRRRYGARVPIAHIGNPLALEAWRPEERSVARTAVDVPATARLVVWHGRIDILRKGLDVLLDAWQHLCQSRPQRDLRLHLIGSGDDAEAFRRLLAARGLRGVTWLDRYLRDRHAILRQLSAADVYVLPSRHEGGPVALLEAMACVLPVVATAVPGVRDILDGGEDAGGIVVEPARPGALAEALGRLVDDDDLARGLGARARRRVEEAFSLEAVGARLDEMLNRRGGS